MGWGRAEEIERGHQNQNQNQNQNEGEDKKVTKGLGQLRKRMEELAVAQNESEGGNEEAVEEEEEEEEEEEDDPMDPLTVLRNIGKQLKKEEDALDADEGKKRRELEERRGDLKRLERVELLYVSFSISVSTSSSSSHG